MSEQSLGQILEAAVSVGSRTLEPQLDSLLAALHAQVGCTGRERGGGRLWLRRLGLHREGAGGHPGDRAGRTGQFLVLPVARSWVQMPAEACRGQEWGPAWQR